MPQQQELFREQPVCPGCGSSDLRREDLDRHQCNRCRWRCIVTANGKARDWLKIGAAGTLQVRTRKRGAAG